MMEPRDIALVIYSCFAVVFIADFIIEGIILRHHVGHIALGCLGGMAASLIAIFIFEFYK